MLTAILDKTRKLKNHLTRLDNRPVGKAALTIILFLDLFVLISIFNGLADHTAQLTSPAEYIPQECRSIIIDERWNETNRLENLARTTSSYQRSYYLPEKEDKTREYHALCQPIIQTLHAIKKDKKLARDLNQLLDIQNESRELRSTLERLKGAYDTALLETIARQPEPKPDVGALRKEIADKTQALNQLTQKQAQLVKSLNANKQVRELFSYIAGISNDDRDRLRDELRRLNFWYPVKRLGMEMVFLLPLFLLFWFWNGKSITANRPFQALVSSHLLVVTLIPVFFRLIRLIYDIIPHKLLKNLIAVLESLKLVALWHYLLIAAGIIAALAFVYLFQKKLFSHEKLVRKRIAKGLCQDCGQRLPVGSRYCPACGFGQYRTCEYCQQATPVLGKYCTECGRGHD